MTAPVRFPSPRSHPSFLRAFRLRGFCRIAAGFTAAVLSFCVAAVCIGASGEDTARARPSKVTIEGRSYENITSVELSPDMREIMVATDSGMLKFAFGTVPAAFLQAWGIASRKGTEVAKATLYTPRQLEAALMRQKRARVIAAFGRSAFSVFRSDSCDIYKGMRIAESDAALGAAYDTLLVSYSQDKSGQYVVTHLDFGESTASGYVLVRTPTGPGSAELDVYAENSVRELFEFDYLPCLTPSGGLVLRIICWDRRGDETTTAWFDFPRERLPLVMDVFEKWRDHTEAAQTAGKDVEEQLAVFDERNVHCTFTLRYTAKTRRSVLLLRSNSPAEGSVAEIPYETQDWWRIQLHYSDIYIQERKGNP